MRGPRLPSKLPGVTPVVEDESADPARTAAGGLLRKKGGGVRPWLLLDATGQTQVIEAGKHAIMRRTGLPGRDLRILDPLLSYPSTVLGRERAIVINLEHIKAIITAQEVLLLNSKDPSVTPFVEELQRRLFRIYHSTNSNVQEGRIGTGEDWKNPYDSEEPSSKVASSHQSENLNFPTLQEMDEKGLPDPKPDFQNGSGSRLLPFEFIALEACLEAACSCLENEARTLEQEAHPALDKLTSKISTLNLERVRQIKSRLVAITGRVQKVECLVIFCLFNCMNSVELFGIIDKFQEAHPALDKLTSKISTLNLERVRQIKSRLVAITGRVQKVRDELEHLLDDDEDMAEMYLTDKLVQQHLDASSRSSLDDRDGMDDGAFRSDVDDDRIPAEISSEANDHPTNYETDRPNIVHQDRLLGTSNVFNGSGHGTHTSSMHSSSKHLDVEELEMLLEAYFVQIDGTLNNLSTLREYVDDTEDYINIMLDDKQNHLLQMGVMLTTATLVVSAFVVVAGIFGMNIKIDLFDETKSGMSDFLWTVGSGATGTFFLYIIAIAWCKRKGLLE